MAKTISEELNDIEDELADAQSIAHEWGVLTQGDREDFLLVFEDTVVGGLKTINGQRERLSKQEVERIQRISLLLGETRSFLEHVYSVSFVNRIVALLLDIEAMPA